MRNKCLSTEYLGRKIEAIPLEDGYRVNTFTDMGLPDVTAYEGTDLTQGLHSAFGSIEQQDGRCPRCLSQGRPSVNNIKAPCVQCGGPSTYKTRPCNKCRGVSTLKGISDAIHRSGRGGCGKQHCSVHPGVPGHP